ncbi:reverse transcriptase domain-containing protein [Tanacetum coccineum]
MMADNCTMAELLQAPTEGYEDAIVVPAITADNFELKHSLLTLITSTMKFPNVPSTSVKLMLFPFSLEGATRIWLEKESPRSILTWDDLVLKFINQFFPPSKTTNLHNEITRFQQRFDESFYEAWDRFNDLLWAYPHHGFSELHQIDTFYNAFNSNDQDSLNSAAGGNFLDKMPRECLKIIESKSKVRQSRSKAIVAKVSTSSSTPGISPDVAELKDMVKALLLDKKNQSQAPATVKAVEESCVTCGGAHSHRNCPATDGKVYHDNIQEYVSQATAVNYNQGNTGYRPPMVANQGPIFRPPVNQPPAYQAQSYQAPAPQTHGVSKADFKSYVKDNDAVMQNMQSQMTNITDLLTKFVNSNTASTSGSGSLPSNTIANPKGDVKAITTRSGVSYKGPQIPPPTSSLPEEVENEPDVTKDTMQPSTENIQPPVVQTNDQIGEPVVGSKTKPTLPYPSRANKEKLREKDDLLALKFMEIFQNLHFELSFADALIHMPKFAPMFRKLLNNKDRMLELTKTPVNENCSAVILKKFPKKLGDPGRPFLRTARALIDVHGEQMTLRHDDQSVTFKVGDTKTFSYNIIESVNQVDVIDIACEEYVQKVLEISESGNPTSPSDPIINSRSPSFTPFGGSDFLMEEIDAFLKHDDLIPPGVDGIYDSEGDTFYLQELLNPPDLELKDLPSHLEYAFLEGEDKLPIIIAKNLKDEDKAALIKVLKSHKHAIAWKIFDIKGIDPHPWVSPVHCVLKKGGITVVKNEENELIPTRLVTGWRVCIDYQKLNDATRKDHFPLPFMDQMLERLAGNEYYCFLDGFSGYFQIPIDPLDQEKTTFTCPYGTFAYRRMPFGLCNAPGTFQRCMVAIFHDMIEKTMEVFMDDFSVFGDSFSSCLSHLDKMLQRCEDTNLVLNWEKCHFMVKEGIVLGHKISKSGIETRLLRDFAAPRIDVVIRDKKGSKKSRRWVHLSSIENPPLSELEKKEITKTFPLETLGMVTFRGDDNTPMIRVPPRAIISDRETHFCNDQFAKVMLKYGVTHRLFHAYHPQTTVDMFEYPIRGLKRILERTVGENRASWSDKLDDALWAFRTAYKTPIGCTPYKLVYGKACHLTIVLEH